MTTDNDGIRSKTENGGAAEAAPTKDESAQSQAAPNGTAAAPAPSELDTLRAERDKLRDQMLRMAADFENFRKRTKRDLDDARERSKSDAIRELLPVFDNLERALQTAGSASDLSSVVEGVRMVLKLFEDTSERMGLARVQTVGQRFDPAVHEAIQQKETDEQPPGTVIAEVNPGYRFGERLVRPAMVIVARKPAAKAEPPRSAGAAPVQAEPAKGAPATEPAAAGAEAETAPSATNTEQKDTDKTA